MNATPQSFDRAKWERFHETLAYPTLRTGSPQRARALQQVRARAADTLQELRTQPLAARHDIKLVNRVLHQAVQQRSALQPAYRRLLQAVWRFLGMPDKLSQQQRQAHGLAQRSNSRWCAEDDRFLQLLTLVVNEILGPQDENKVSLLPEDRAFFDHYLKKSNKRVQLLPAYKEQHTVASRTMVQLLRIRRGMDDKFSPERLTQMLDKATTLREGGEAAKKCAPFSVEDFNLLSMLDGPLLRLCMLKDAKLLPEEYTTSLGLLKKLQIFSEAARKEISAGSPLRSGDIEFDDLTLVRRSYQSSAGWLDHGMMAVTHSKFEHTGVALLGARRAEMDTGGFSKHATFIDQMIASTAHRIDWQRLVTPAGQKSLQATRGPQWASTLQLDFENRIERLLTKPQIQDASFDNRLLRVPLRLHRQLKPDDLTKLPTGPMFCSEFTARTLAVTLHGMEADLRAQEASRKAPVFHRIFSRYENYKAVSPGYLERLLKPYTSIVPHAPALRKYVAVPSTKHHLAQILHFAGRKAGLLRAI